MSRGHRRDPTPRSVVVAFLVSVVASAAVLAVYNLDGGPQRLGLALALALGALGWGLVVWSKRLMPRGPWEEERPEIAPSAEDEALTTSTFRDGAEAVGRRRLLGRLLALAVGALGLATLWPARSLGPRPGDALFETPWRAGVPLVDAEGRKITVDRLRTGGIVTAFPEGHVGSADAQLVVIRVGIENVRPRAGREDWSPFGYVAYSRVCTHAGCAVSLYEPERFALLCPCHQATFDVLQAARPVFGPAPRPLPQLPLEVDDAGRLLAAGGLSGVVGPGFWELG